MNWKGILYAALALVVFIVFAIVYFIILSFIVKVGVGLAGAEGEISSNFLAISAAILTAGTMIAGGKLGNMFD